MQSKSFWKLSMFVDKLSAKICKFDNSSIPIHFLNENDKAAEITALPVP